MEKEIHQRRQFEYLHTKHGPYHLEEVPVKKVVKLLNSLNSYA